MKKKGIGRSLLQVCMLQDLSDDENEPSNDNEKKDSFKTDIAEGTVVALIILHLAAVCGLYLFLEGSFHWQTVLYNFIIGYASGLGVTIGALRIWSKQSYEANFSLRIFLLIFQTMATQNSVWAWVRDHRQHHKFFRTDADPRNPKRGLFFSHIGWLMLQRHPEVDGNSKLIDMSDLNSDTLVMIQKRFYLPIYLVLLVLQLVIPWYCWNETLWLALLAYASRTVAVLHSTFCIRSSSKSDGKVDRKEDGVDKASDGDSRDCPCSGDDYYPTSGLLRLCQELGVAHRLPDRTKK